MLAQSQFSTLLSGIYDTAHRLLAMGRGASHSRVSHGRQWRRARHERSRRRLSAYVAPLTEPAFLTSYNAYYHKVSPLMPRIKALPAGSVVTRRMVLPRRDFEKSEIYNDWILPQGLCNKLYTVLSSGSDQRIMIGVHRTREFEGDQIELCRLLAPSSACDGDQLEDALFGRRAWRLC